MSEFSYVVAWSYLTAFLIVLVIQALKQDDN